jgi:hypothetical protein
MRGNATPSTTPAGGAPIAPGNAGGEGSSAPLAWQPPDAFAATADADTAAAIRAALPFVRAAGPRDQVESGAEQTADGGAKGETR